MEGVRIRDFDFIKLMDFAAEAQGEVFLKTDERDVLNLRSQLTGLLVLSGAMDQNVIREATVVCSDRADESRLFRLNLNGK